jgi:YidC/Oxa1 family membrane protein insertase
MPIGATLHDYRSLSASNGPVELARAGIPLASYRLRVGSDTVALDGVAFSVDSSAMDAAGKRALTFRTTVAGDTVAITYSFVPDRYLMQVRGTVHGATAQNDALLITLPHGLRSNEADSANDQRAMALVVKPVKEDVDSYSFSKLSKLDSTEVPVASAPLSWVATKSKYFLVALIAEQQPFPRALLAPRGAARTPTSESAVVVQPVGADGGFAFQLYTGPQEWERLVALGQDFTNINSYGGIFSPIIEPFTVIVMRVLLWMHSHLALAYGWVVVIFGVGLRALLWPLYQSSMRTSLRMQRLQPELQALQKKFKNNPEKQHAEMMRLYKEHNMSPFSPLSGCLPMLLPMPILYALYFVFENTIAFRGVPFLWMADIAQKDPLYILPIVMGISMFVLSWIGLRTAPPNAQTKVMGYFFPVLMTVFFLKLPAGLNLYYAVQNIAALPQQWLIAKERAKAGTPSTSKAEGASLVRR